MIFRIALLSTLTLASVTSAFAGKRSEEERLYQQCERADSRLERVRSVYLLSTCMNFYFNNQGVDGPGPFEKFIRFSYRSLEVEPYQRTVYSDLAWILWSNWVSWKNAPTQYPNQEGSVDDALSVLRQGEAYYSDSALYHKEAADIILPLAEVHRSDLLPFVVEHYEHANRLSQDIALSVRVRLNLGHLHRKGDRPDEARRYYESVLEIDKNNEVALRYLGGI